MLVGNRERVEDPDQVKVGAGDRLVVDGGDGIDVGIDHVVHHPLFGQSNVGGNGEGPVEIVEERLRRSVVLETSETVIAEVRDR